MLTSKEIIERTGISRATLNNYIASGLVPRPQVLPPGPEHGDAPRIGYFPDDTITRIETIQRLKREGWSITRISGHFGAQPGAETLDPPALPDAPPTRALPPPPVSRAAVFAGDPTLTMFVGDVHYPAYLVDDSFRLVWQNEQTHTSPLSPLGASDDSTDNVFRHLMDLDADSGRDAIVRFHLEVAKDRAHRTEELFRGLLQDQAEELRSLYAATRRADAGLVTQARLAATGTLPARLLYAVHFREAVLFAFGPAPATVPGEAAGRTAAAGRPTAATAAAAPQPGSLTNMPLAVLVATLQDATSLWVKLTAQEYFELLNEVWAELEQIYRSHGGRPGRQPGEVLVWYFASDSDTSYLWNALAAAQQAREAMRRVSRRWQARKGWDVELCMNVGVDEGREWIGAVGAPAELRVLGEAADRAEQLSRCGRMGTILSTRTLLGKLPPVQRQRVTYGVPRRDGSGARVLFTFDRLQDIAAGAPVPPRLADVAVAELLDLTPPTPLTSPGGAG
ncbi:MerR family transcriptional regulator [Ramlibacter sp. PS3R-8]|uniref:MerR family transcriptional regulator n=1 Tax=Ramlibacter sp. PS3R-8 TaxID=3133437 RepID=UPI0030A11AD3